MALDLEFAPNQVGERIKGIFRAYTTRVGSSLLIII
jgi:adenylosuccinate synthase